MAITNNVTSQQAIAANIDPIQFQEVLKSKLPDLISLLSPDEGPGGLKKKNTLNMSMPQLAEPKGPDLEQLMILAMDIRSKLQEKQVELSKEGIKADKAKKKDAHQERLKKLQEVVKKMRAASKKGLFGKIAGWVGAALVLAVAAVATVATGGAAAPLLAMAAVNMAFMVAQETGAMDKMLEAIGNDDLRLAVQITITAAIIAANIAVAVYTGGTGAVAAYAAVSAAISGVTGVMQGAAAIGVAKDQADAANAQADAMDFDKILEQLQAMMDEQMDRLKELILYLSEISGSVMSMLEDSFKTNSKIVAMS